MEDLRAELRLEKDPIDSDSGSDSDVEEREEKMSTYLKLKGELKSSIRNERNILLA